MKVLLGVGGNEDSWRALDRTAERTVSAGDALTVAVYDHADADLEPDEVEREVNRRLTEYDLDVSVRRIGDDDPGIELTEIAENEDFDAIVLGGGQRSPMGKIRVGPVAEYVVLNARTTVTLIR